MTKSISSVVVRARIDKSLKVSAEKAFASMDLTLSDAFRLFLRQTVAQQALPFVVRVPNAETKAAIADARKGGGKRHASVDALFSELTGNDQKG